jgi:hypothetical protein
MPESSRNIFLLHFGLIRDDICNLHKKVHARKKEINFKSKFSEQYLCTPILKLAYLIQFSMPESSRNIFLLHSGHIRNDICNLYKKVHARKKGMNFKVTFSEQFHYTPILKWT